VTLAETEAALRAADYPRALTTALEAWRATRSAELADLIDRITTRCTLPKAPQTKGAIHRWWMQHALEPDPLMIGALLGSFHLRMYGNGDLTWPQMRARWTEPNPVIEAIATEPTPQWWLNYAQSQGGDMPWPHRVQNWVDRLAAMIRWPHDPRLTRVLVDILGDADCMVYGESNQRMCRLIADRLIEQRDTRAMHRLTKLVSNEVQPTFKQRITNPLIAELATVLVEPASVEAVQIAACVAQLPVAARPEVELDHLWRDVAAHPDDDSVRLVLADALIAAGDNRGELITLQCMTDPEKTGHVVSQSQRLIRQEWPRWMGDLALVLARRGTELSRGMLDKIRVGLSSTPAWAWDAIVGHRELATVREVRPAQVEPTTFARLVARLERCPRMIAIDAHEVIEELARTWTNQPVEEVYYSPISALAHYRRTRPPWEATIALLGQVAPHLARIDLGPMWFVTGEFGPQTLEPARVIAMLEWLPATFRKLARVRIEPSSLRDEVKPVVAALPFVELVSPPRV
jgi:uncharacterized protein (TIGR02996 family)